MSSGSVNTRQGETGGMWAGRLPSPRGQVSEGSRRRPGSERRQLPRGNGQGPGRRWHCPGRPAVPKEEPGGHRCQRKQRVGEVRESGIRKPGPGTKGEVSGQGLSHREGTKMVGKSTHGGVGGGGLRAAGQVETRRGPGVPDQRTGVHACGTVSAKSPRGPTRVSKTQACTGLASFCAISRLWGLSCDRPIPPSATLLVGSHLIRLTFRHPKAPWRPGSPEPPALSDFPRRHLARRLYRKAGTTTRLGSSQVSAGIRVQTCIY